MSRHKFLDTPCEHSDEGHQMGFVDAWPDREYNTGKDIWKHKYYCVFCLGVIVVSTDKGRPG